MGAESIWTDPSRQERWRSMSATSPGCALRLLDDFLVDGLDVRPDAVAVATERVLGEAGLVLRRQLIPDLRLHLVERRAVRRRLLHGRDEVDQGEGARPGSAGLGGGRGVGARFHDDAVHTGPSGILEGVLGFAE